MCPFKYGSFLYLVTLWSRNGRGCSNLHHPRMSLPNHDGAMINVKNEKLSLQLGERKFEFYLAQAMCPLFRRCLLSGGHTQEVLSYEMVLVKSPKDPLEACLVGSFKVTMWDATLMEGVSILSF